MKNPEANTLRIEPRKFHAATVGMAMVLAYVDYEYFVQTFCWVFQPPIRIAIDTVTIVSLGIIFNVLSFAHIIATSRTYIVSTKEPLNNSLCSVPTRCISRHLRLVKVISVQNSHYLSAFLLRFPKKGRLPLCQVVESFRPAMASAYKLAQANIAYSRFSFFFRPRYTVFL